MRNEVVPIISLEKAPLSSNLISHLNHIKNETGRYICFRDAWDIKRIDPSFSAITKARAIAEHNQPFLAIDDDMKEISRARYDPIRHDPFIAHEAGHLILWIDGYRQIGLINQPPKAHWAVTAVGNWLSDPLINKQILEHGFNISLDRLKEIQASIKSLNRGRWKDKPKELSIRVGLSFLLEPNIPSSAIRSLKLALRKGLNPICVKTIFDLYDSINVEEITSSDIHDVKVKQCFEILNEHLNLSLTEPEYSPKYVRFSKSEIDNWVMENIVKTKEWP